jgi:hypothetical protein
MFTQGKAGEMRKPLSYVLTLLVGLALGWAAGTIARPRGFRKPTVAEVGGDPELTRPELTRDLELTTRDVELTRDLEVPESKAAYERARQALGLPIEREP